MRRRVLSEGLRNKFFVSCLVGLLALFFGVVFGAFNVAFCELLVSFLDAVFVFLILCSAEILPDFWHYFLTLFSVLLISCFHSARIIV